jgi:NAD(P)-dependent dehydrogenase (short-subunit alcohol dehydrogenase family)
VNPFDLTGRVAVVTGGYGVLGGAIATDLGRAGVRVGVLGRRSKAAELQAERIRVAGGDAIALVADVLDEAALRGALSELLDRWNRVDILVNAAGGNVARARSDRSSVFAVPLDAFDEALRLNLHGTVIPSMVFGEAMAQGRTGCIVNISSVTSSRVLSGVMAYSAAKGAIDNVTRWLAVELARRYGEGFRVNAIAPGFILSEQNRAVLVTPEGEFTDRAQSIIAHTPMGRLGKPEELTGTVRWLCSDAASFVTGIVVHVDGGFTVFSGI